MTPLDKRMIHRLARGGWRCFRNAHPEVAGLFPEQWVPSLTKRIVGQIWAELRIRFPDMPDRLRLLPDPEESQPPQRPTG